MAKLLGIDYGKKRTGIAETDDLQIVASGLTTVETPKIWEFLDQYLSDNQVEKIIIGESLDLNGEPNPIEADIKKFINKFQEKYPNIEVIREDERYTSKIAFESMIKGGIKKKKRRNKALIDQVSAALILQSYLYK
ncbi:MAG TPA: Holliday junction resolvase RuvX [Flavobacteriales bacterium]|nr:Holliday junction resolvase RuvX [Flavobacteriales bacterium]